MGSVLPKAPENPDVNKTGFVHLIMKDWEPYEPYDRGERFETDEEPIEGCTLNNVGWMRVPFDSVMVDVYCNLRDVWAWETQYRRPPDISC